PTTSVRSTCLGPCATPRSTPCGTIHAFDGWSRGSASPPEPLISVFNCKQSKTFPAHPILACQGPAPRRTLFPSTGGRDEKAHRKLARNRRGRRVWRGERHVAIGTAHPRGGDLPDGRGPRG